jgi:hypothetical protein
MAGRPRTPRRSRNSDASPLGAARPHLANSSLVGQIVFNSNMVAMAIKRDGHKLAHDASEAALMNNVIQMLN